MNSSPSSPNLDYPEVCSPEQALSVQPTDFATDSVSSTRSPIDDFYLYTRSLIKLGTQPFIDGDPVHGRLLLLGLIGGTEHYFRSLLAGLVTRCPCCQEKCENSQVPLLALIYYSDDRIPFSLLEGISLAGADDIIKQTKKLTGNSIEKESSVGAALLEFDKLCVIRHAAIHSRGEFSARNIIGLGMEPKSLTQQKAVHVEFGGFQSAVAVCESAVRAYNRHLYRHSIEAWLRKPIFRGEWDDDRTTFSRLHELFVSRVDGDTQKVAYNAYRSLYRRIQGRLGNLGT